MTNKTMYISAMIEIRLLIMTIRKDNTFYSTKENIEIPKSLQTWINEHGKEDMLCSGIYRYYKKRDSTRRSFYSHSQNDSNKSSILGDHKRWVIYTDF